jgi:hypothetical protein
MLGRKAGDASVPFPRLPHSRPYETASFLGRFSRKPAGEKGGMGALRICSDAPCGRQGEDNREPSPKSTISVSKQAAKRVIIRLKCIRATPGGERNH